MSPRRVLTVFGVMVAAASLPKVPWVLSNTTPGLSSVYAQSAGEPMLDAATIDRWMTELSNWNRWGATDQRGTVNLMTDATRKAAAALVKEGVSVSLSRDADPVQSADNGRPLGFTMISSGQDPEPMFAMETLTVSHHGSAYTHLDALSHMFYKGKTYNGYSKDLVDRTGAGTLDVTAFKTGLVGRGVLVDIPRLKNLPYLEPTTAITVADLEAWEKFAGVKIASGDILLVRTGRWARRAKVGAWDIGVEAAGLHPAVATWLHARDIAILGTDGHSEVMPSVVTGVPFPMHQLLIVAMGTPLLDNCDLERVAEAAAQRKRWTFLVTASPLAVPRGTGSPVNPIATF
jgi:kynurenine formamidase